MPDPDAVIASSKPEALADHNLIPEAETVVPGILYEMRPARRPDGSTAEGLYNAWITLDNPAQYNSYTPDMTKGAILAFRRASVDRAVNAVLFTGTRDKAF
jgi:6-oxo-cyclohex-1-ene-carbonyl-CoA hydrolase